MSSGQEILKPEDAKAILKILKKYGVPFEAYEIELDENDNPKTPVYIDCRLYIHGFDTKSKEDMINNMILETDSNG